MGDVIFKEIAGFPGYRIGSDGSVWSCRDKRGRQKNSWHPIACSRRRKQGYLTCCFRIGPKNHVRYVHRLVLEAFIGPCPDGMECRHRNGNPADNRLENLCWATHQENAADKAIHGTQLLGRQCPNAKLTEWDIPVILRLYDEGIPQEVIGRVFGVTQTTIGEIVRGEKWRHVRRDDSPRSSA
jgi:HNH endonuclease